MGVYKKKRKKRNPYYYRFQHQGQIQKQEGFKTRSDATIAEGRKREEVNAPPILTIPSVSFQELSTDYLKECRIKMQKNTWRNKASVYRRFLGFIGSDIEIEMITPKQISNFLQDRALADNNSCANRDLKEINAMFNWALNQKRINSGNPAYDIEPYPEDKEHRYIPPAEDIAKVRLIASGDIGDIIETTFRLAARRGEIIHMPNSPNKSHAVTWDDVNFEQGWIRLSTRKRKGGNLEYDYLPIAGGLKDILYRRWKQRDRQAPYIFTYTEKDLRKMMLALCNQAEVKPFTLHSLRHFAASILNDANKSINQIQHVLRHRRQTTTERYLHLMPNRLQEAFDFLDSDKSVTHCNAKARKGDAKK